MQVAHASLPLRQKVERFHRNYAANTAIALVAGDGGAWFAGPGLEELDDLMRPGYDRGKLVRPRKASTFSPTSTSGYSRCCWPRNCQSTW